MATAQQFFAPTGAPQPLGFLPPPQEPPGMLLQDAAMRMDPNGPVWPAGAAVPAQLNAPASAFFSAQNSAPYVAAQRQMTEDDRIKQGLQEKMSYIPSAAYSPSQAAAAGYIHPSLLGIEAKVGPGGTPIGVNKAVMSPEEYGYSTNPRKPREEMQKEAEVAAQDAYAQRQQMASLANKAYENGGREELRHLAFIRPENETPKALTQKINSGEVITGRDLPDWLRKSAPGVDKLYWYRSELSPDMQKLMNHLVPRRAEQGQKRNKKEAQSDKRKKVTQDG